MNILVTRQNLAHITELLNKKDLLVFDIESTGLNAYHAAKMFSVALSDGVDNYYFNFQRYKDMDEKYLLEPTWLKPIVERQRLWIAHNAKFDLHFMDKAGVKPRGPVVCTEVMANVFNNNYKYSGGYGLNACANRWLNESKDDRVKNWMDDNNAFTLGFTPDGRSDKHYFFNLVPFEIISEYAMKDAEVTFKLYNFLQQNMYENHAHSTEINLTSVLFEMERLGIKIDREYCLEAQKHENARAVSSERALKAHCGGEFTDSAKFLAPVLESRGYKLPTTEKGNVQVTDEVLGQMPGDPLAELILEYRDATKRSNTYFGNYLSLADKNDVIHSNFRQCGAGTGRMSCFNPNLQNIPTEDTGLFPLRRAFIARHGCKFVSIDFKAMEFRLLLDYANEKGLIGQVKAGYDPHQATADLTGLDRKSAKILNFGIAYRMGLAKIGKAIGCSEAEAGVFRKKYFQKLPGVQWFIYEAPKRQEQNGFAFNWAGRRFYHEIGKDGKSFSYKAANSIIQGGCADIVKLAMVRLHEFLKPHQTRMLVQVHDELIFEAPESEFHLIPEIVKIMSGAYTPKNGMDMDCSVSVGKNLCDLEEWVETKNKARETLSAESEQRPQEIAAHVGVSSK